MIFNEYPDREALVLGLVGSITSQLQETLNWNGRALLSVPGGSTPGPVFDLLSGISLDWSKVAIVLNDERWVPEESDRSNTRVLRARLLRDKAAAATLLPLYAPTDVPEEAVEQLSAQIAPHLPISVLLLGMGEDMHTASLFAGGDRLAAALAPDAPILMPMRAEAAGEPRMTLTAQVLAGATHIHLLITGAAKRAALERAMGLDVLEAPVKAILGEATVHWAE
ncbi:MAG: 6-phosphogluconolactonase [Cypionkella sp.]